MTHMQRRSLASASSALAAALAALCAGAAREGQAQSIIPNFTLTSYSPTVGASTPTVPLEPIRRPGQDAFRLNFDARVRNDDGQLLELKQLRARYTSPSGVAPTRTIDALDAAAWLGFRNDAFGFDGTVTQHPADSDADVVNLKAAVSSPAGTIEVGWAEDGGARGFYQALAHADGNDGGKITEKIINWAGSAPAEAHATAMAIASTGAHAFVAGGFITVSGRRRPAILLRTADANFALQSSDHRQIPGCTTGDAAITGVAVAGTTYATQAIVATGWADCGGQIKPFVMRYKNNLTLDTAFDGDGIKVLDNPWLLPMRGEAIALRTETGGTKIYIATTMGPQAACTSERPVGCHIAVAKLNWTGTTHTAFNSGWGLVGFPNSSGHRARAVEFGSGTGVNVAGYTVDSGNLVHAGVARLTSAGQLDTSFGASGTIRIRVANRDTWGTGLKYASYSSSSKAIVMSGLTKMGSGASARSEVALVRWNEAGTTWLSTGLSRQQPGHAVEAGGLALDANKRAIVASTRHGWGQLVRFRTDGRLDWRGVLDPGETQSVFWPDENDLQSAPSAVELGILTHQKTGYFTTSFDAQVSFYQYRFPSNVFSMPANVAWLNGSHQHHLGVENTAGMTHPHRYSESQRFGYDWGASRWDVASNSWKETKAASSSLNDATVVYGLPVMAGRAGRVVGCWRNAAENPGPGPATVYAMGGMPGGGNMYWIEDNDGLLRALYAHLQPHSQSPLPACPNTCTTWKHDAGPWEPGKTICSEYLRPVDYVTVSVGAHLGIVGNSGASGGPHLHFHVERGARNAAVGQPVVFSYARTDVRNPPDDFPAVSLAGQWAPAPRGWALVGSPSHPSQMWLDNLIAPHSTP
jgi:hypothetical protein